MFKKITQKINSSNITTSSNNNSNNGDSFAPKLSKNIFSSREVESFSRIDTNSINEFKNPFLDQLESKGISEELVLNNNIFGQIPNFSDFRIQDNYDVDLMREVDVYLPDSLQRDPDFSNEEFSGFKYSDGNKPTKRYRVNSVFNIINKSLKVNKDYNFKILVHENSKINKSGDSINTNMLFLSKQHIFKNTFLDLQNNEIDKYESVLDRVLNFIDVSTHEKIIDKQVKTDIETIGILDDLTTFNKRLEKTINYGNIVEDFIQNKSSTYNGKILNTILEKPKLYINISGKDDKRLLDIQEGNSLLKITNECLEDFYLKVLDFRFMSSFDDNITETFSQKIVNTDMLVGQLLYNYSLSSYSVFPNSSHIFAMQSADDLNRFLHLNQFPIIKISDHFEDKLNGSLKDKFIIGSENNHVLNINGSEFNINNCLKNKKSTESYEFPSLATNPDNKFILIDNSNSNVTDIETNYSKIRSIYGKVHRNDTYPFYPMYNNTAIGLFFRDLRGFEGTFSLFDNVFIDVKSDDFFNYDSATFLMFSERFFSSNFIDNAVLEGDDDNAFIYDNNRDFSANNVRSINSLDRGVTIGTYNDLTDNNLPYQWNVYDKVSGYFKENIFNNFNDDSLFNLDDTKNLYTYKLKRNISKLYAKNIVDSYRKSININRLSLDNPGATIPNIKLDLFIPDASRDVNILNKAVIMSLIDKAFSSVNDDDLDFSNVFRQISDSGQDRVTLLSPRTNVSDSFSFQEEFADSSSSFRNSIKTEAKRDLEHTNGSNWRPESLVSNSKGLYDDCFVFKASNTFFSEEELSEWNFNRTRRLTTNDRNSIKYVLKNKDRLITSSNRSDTVKIMYEDLSSYHYLYMKISNSVNRIRREKSKNMQKIFNNFAEKGKAKLLEDETYALLYDNFEETSFDTFKESPFISEESFYKNNFAKTFTDVKNTSSAFVSNENFDTNHLATSREYREYLSKIYTKSFVRDKNTLFTRLLLDNINIFEKSKNYDNDALFGFDVLLSTSLSNRNKIDANNLQSIVKLILSTAVANLSGIKNQLSGLYEKPYVLNGKNINQAADSNEAYIFKEKFIDIFGEENFNKVIENVYDQKTIKSQKNFVFRSVKVPSASTIVDLFTASSGKSTANFKYLDGKLVSLMFPFVFQEKTFEDVKAGQFRDTLSNVVEKAEAMNGLVISEGGSPEDELIDLFNQDIKNLATSLAYNHDIYIDSENTGVDYYETKENDPKRKTKFLKSFDFSKENSDRGSTLRISYFDYKFYNSRLGDSDDTLFPYSPKNVYIPFSYFYLSEIEGTFSNKLTKIAIDLIKVFDFDYSSFNNIEDIMNWIDENRILTKVLQDIFEAFSNIFMDSYNNYIALLVNDFNIKKLNVNIEEKFTFARGVSSLKEKAVSDLKIIFNKIDSDNRLEYIKENFYNLDNYLSENNTNTMFTPRIEFLQNVYQVLKNSDISNAICHDLIHGYFKNFEDNIQNRNENISDTNEKISLINQKINSIENIENIDISSLMFNEFYQNSLSKNIQELMYYKNIYKETFVNNNIFNTTKEKYLNSNLFNHRKAFIENKYKLSMKGLNTVTRLFSKFNFKNYDMVTVPIEYKMAEKLGEKSIVEFTVLPVNLKYPEIEYEEIKYYYVPFLTNITSNYVNYIEDSLDDFIGFYEDTEKLSERYKIISNQDAKRVIKDVIIKKFKLLAAASSSSSIIGLDSNAGAEKVFRDIKISNAVKSLNFVRQKNFDENVKDVNIDINNLISNNTISLFRNISQSNLQQVFDNFNINSLNRSGFEYFNFSSNKDILENNEFYKKFLLMLDKDMSEAEIIKNLIPNKFYDTFNFIISRDNLRVIDSSDSIEQRVRGASSSRVRDDIFVDQETENYFMYYIGAKVL